VNNAEARVALEHGNVQAFLRMLRVGEGTTDEDGYRRHFGGELAPDLSRHPRRAITKMVGNAPITSTACGAYQFLSRTWDDCQGALKLPDFSPESQDLAAVFLIDRAGALGAVIAGQFEVALAKCAGTWASLPGSPYGQPVISMERCKAEYEKWGGVYEDDAIVHLGPEPVHVAPRPDDDNYPEAKMPIPALITALLPTVVEMIPRLASIFKPGSPVAERNVAAAGAVMEIVTKATGAVNAQEAVEKMRADPAVAAAAAKAVEARWFELVPADGGGIDGARKADAALIANGTVWQSPSFWVALGLLPLVYMIVGSIVGLFGTPWPAAIIRAKDWPASSAKKFSTTELVISK
jgi:muramidase (phage lysozyme)